MCLQRLIPHLVKHLQIFPIGNGFTDFASLINSGLTNATFVGGLNDFGNGFVTGLTGTLGAGASLFGLPAGMFGSGTSSIPSGNPITTYTPTTTTTTTPTYTPVIIKPTTTTTTKSSLTTDQQNIIIYGGIATVAVLLLNKKKKMI